MIPTPYVAFVVPLARFAEVASHMGRSLAVSARAIATATWLRLLMEAIVAEDIAIVQCLYVQPAKLTGYRVSTCTLPLQVLEFSRRGNIIPTAL